jgi:hypothetical protein
VLSCNSCSVIKISSVQHWEAAAPETRQENFPTLLEIIKDLNTFFG